MVLTMSGEVAIVVLENGIPVCALSPEKFQTKFGFYPKTTKVGMSFQFPKDPKDPNSTIYVAHATETAVSV